MPAWPNNSHRAQVARALQVRLADEWRAVCECTGAAAGTAARAHAGTCDQRAVPWRPRTGPGDVSIATASSTLATPRTATSSAGLPGPVAHGHGAPFGALAPALGHAILQVYPAVSLGLACRADAARQALLPYAMLRCSKARSGRQSALLQPRRFDWGF